MASYSQIAKGLRARRRGVPFRTLFGDDVLVDIGVIDGIGQARILEYASAFAKKRGTDPREGEPLYEFGKAVMTCALGVLDHAPERPGEDPCRSNPGDTTAPFFASADEVLEACDRDRAFILAAAQESLQTSTSPMQRGLSNDEYWAKILSLAAEEETLGNPFSERWEPALQWSFLRTTAKYLVAAMRSRTPKSSDSSDSESKDSASSTNSESENDLQSDEA